MKLFCSTSKNITIAWVKIEAANILLVEEKRLSGIIGRVIDKFYRLDREHMCRFIAFDTIGTRAQNGSFTGVLQALKEKKVDLYGRPSAIHLYEDFMRITDAVNEGTFTVGHIESKIGVESSSSATSLHMFDIEIWLQLFPILAFLLTFIFLFQLVNVSDLKKKTELIGNCLFEVDFRLTESMNFVSIIALFYLIYFMILKSILSNNIKTNTVIVNTSHIVDNENDLLKTPRKICYWQDIELNLSESAPNGSYLAKILEKSKEKNNNTVCSNSQNPDDFLNHDYNNVVFFSSEIPIFATTSMLANVFPNANYYISKNAFFKVIHINYFRNDIDDEFVHIPQKLMEFGLDEKDQHDIETALKSTFEFKMRLFRSKQEYIDEFSHISNLNLNYIQDSAKLFLILNLIIIALFVSNRIFEKLFKFSLYLKSQIALFFEKCQD